MQFLLYKVTKLLLLKLLHLQSEKKSSLLALNGIKKEAEYGIRTVLDVLDAEVEYLECISKFN